MRSGSYHVDVSAGSPGEYGSDAGTIGSSSVQVRWRCGVSRLLPRSVGPGSSSSHRALLESCHAALSSCRSSSATTMGLHWRARLSR